MCDEISLGLAPIVIRDIYARIPAIVAEGLSLVIVEQDIVQALKTARHVYCLQEGRVALQGEAKTLTREKSPRRILEFKLCDDAWHFLRRPEAGLSRARSGAGLPGGSPEGCSAPRVLTNERVGVPGMARHPRRPCSAGSTPCSPPALSLIFGVMRLVNIAHGDLIVLAAYVALVTTQMLGINPLISLVIVVPVMAAIGYGLQRALLNRTLGDDLLPPLLVTFGLSVIIQNGLLELFTADSVKLNAGSVEIESIAVGGGLAVGVLPLIQFALAVAVIGGLQWLFYRTALGRAFRATSDDQSVAQLMGLNNAHVFGLAMALSLAIVAIAGVLLAVRANFDPAIGPARLIFGFEAVIIGGLGSMWGTLAGGIILGVAQAIGAQLDPGWNLLAGHIAFLVVLALRPEGLFPKVQG